MDGLGSASRFGQFRYPAWLSYRRPSFLPSFPPSLLPPNSPSPTFSPTHDSEMTSVHSVRSQNRLKRNDLQPAIPTPKDLFFPVTLYIPPAPVSPEEEPIESPSSPEYTAAVARIDASQVYLTASMAATVKALLSVLNTHLSPLTVHPLVQLVASPETTNEKLVELATKTEAGLNAFLAKKGPASIPAARADPSADPPVANTQDQPMPTPAASSSPAPSPSASRAAVSTRSQRVHRGCVERDRSICQLTNQADSGVVSHIIPFSVQGSKAVDFWNLVALFRGEAEAVALQVAALGTTSDTIRNVWWLSEAAHTRFDKGWISVVPQLSDVPFPYTPETVAEVTPLSPDVCVWSRLKFPSTTQSWSSHSVPTHSHQTLRRALSLCPLSTLATTALPTSSDS